MSEVVKKEKPETNLYEIGYLLSPMITEESLTTSVDEFIRSAIERAGGVVTSQTQPKRRVLAYEVGKSVNHKRTNFREAYFGAIRFEALPDILAEIKKNLDQGELILRFIMVNIPRRAEAPVAPKRIPTRRAKVADKVTGEKTEISKEEIDKEIEGLLTPAA